MTINKILIALFFKWNLQPVIYSLFQMTLFMYLYLVDFHRDYIKWKLWLIKCRKLKNYRFKRHKWSPKDLPTPLFTAQLCSVGQILCNSYIWPNGVIPTLRDRKLRKSKVKCGQNYRKFRNLLEAHKWHENQSIGPRWK